MKYTINELANSKGVSQPVREALLQMADYKQLYEQVCEQYDVLTKELEATKQARSAPVVDCHATGVCVQSGLRAERPAPVQEPVSGARACEVLSLGEWVLYSLAMAKEAIELGWPVRYLVLDNPPAAPVQEPVAWANPNDLKNFDMKVRTNGGPLHTVALCLCTPPAQPATEESSATQPVQEPVAWVTVEDGKCISTRSADFRHIADGQYQLYVGPLAYEVPAAIKTLEALGYIYEEGEQWTAPPAAQRQWVGLTETEVDECYESVIFNPDIEPTRVLVYQAIEAKLKEKNT
jgi:hypothetical protein